MTPLPAFDELIVERRDLPEYEIPPRCANPRCPNMADDKHEVYPRSQAAGVIWWVELPGRFLIGNRVGLCRDCHRSNDAHTTQIIWDAVMERLAWVDFRDQWADALDPMPPIHKIEESHPADLLDRRSMDKFPEPDVDEVIRQELEETPDEIKPFVPEEAPIQAETVEAPDAPDGLDDAALLAQRVRATNEFLRAVEEAIPEVEPAEATTFPPEGMRFTESSTEAIQPIVVPELPEPPPAPLEGDDAATVARARAATEEAQRHADETGFADGWEPWRALVRVHPEELHVEAVSGDLRVLRFLQEQIELAKRAPKPREPRPPADPDRPREPGKAKRTWSIAVPVEAREEGLVALGEDGFNEIEDALDDLRQRFGDDDAPGWKFRTLVKALAWMQTMYVPDGEDR